MALDFPASPTLGQVFTSGNVTYAWNGYAWVGGSQAREAQEQFFDLSGMTQWDINVPSWAKQMMLDGALYLTTGTAQGAFRYSLDGSTFLAGASDYGYGGPTHQDGTTSFSKTAITNGASILMSGQGDNTIYPHKFEASIQLQRPDTAKVLGLMQCYVKMVDTNAANLTRTSWFSGQLWATSAGSALGIKAIRLYPTSSNLLAGSYVNVRWLGVPPAPQSAIGATVFIGDGPPASPIEGALWWRSTDGRLFIWFNDGTSSQWVQC